MKILIELPSWLGDAVMTTPAIENIVKHFSGVDITLIGSFISIEALKNHPNITKTYVLEKNYLHLFKSIKNNQPEMKSFIDLKSEISEIANFIRLKINGYMLLLLIISNKTVIFLTFLINDLQ